MAFHGDDVYLVNNFGQDKFLFLRSEDFVSMSSITGADENADIPEDNINEVQFRRLVSENAVTDYQDRVLKVGDARLALPSPPFGCVGIPDRYFIATTPHKGEDTLGNLLGKEDVVAKLYNYYDKKKVSYSGTYKKLVGDILDLTIKLWDNGLAPKFDMSNIAVIVDPRSEMEHFTIRVLEVYKKPKVPKEFVTFIESMNQVAALDTVVSSSDLTSLLASITYGWSRKGLFGMPFFWDHSQRMAFICALHDYLQRNPAFRFCGGTFTSFAQDWEQKFAGDGTLSLLRMQDGVDRKLYGIKPLLKISKKMKPQDIKENNLRNCVDVMRQTYCHIARITSAILTKNSIWIGINRHDLGVIYDRAFPGHIQRLKARVDELHRNGDLAITLRQDGSFFLR